MGVFQKTFSTVTRFHDRRMVFANPSRDIPIIVKTSSGTRTEISQFNYVDLEAGCCGFNEEFAESDHHTYGSLRDAQAREEAIS